MSSQIQLINELGRSGATEDKRKGSEKHVPRMSYRGEFDRRLDTRYDEHLAVDVEASSSYRERPKWTPTDEQTAVNN